MRIVSLKLALNLGKVEALLTESFSCSSMILNVEQSRDYDWRNIEKLTNLCSNIVKRKIQNPMFL